MLHGYLSIILKIEATTQLYLTLISNHFKQKYKLSILAYNIHRTYKPVATDTVYDGTNAIGSRVPAAQLCSGIKSLACIIYLMKTNKEFAKTLLHHWSGKILQTVTQICTKYTVKSCMKISVAILLD